MDLPFAYFGNISYSDVMYMKRFVYELRMYMKVINDHPSEFPIFMGSNPVEALNFFSGFFIPIAKIRKSLR